MKSKIKEIVSNKYIYCFTLITLVFFGIFIRMEFATDTYATLSFSLKEFINQFTSSGRFVLIILGGILKILNVKPKTIYICSFILAIFCFILSLYKLYCIIKNDIGSEILKKIIPVIILLNAFSIELFLFVEKGVMVLSLTLCIFAVETIKKYFESKNKRYILITAFLMLLANFSYQGVVGIFVAISTVYILKYSKDIKQFIVNNLIVGLSYGIPAIIDYLLIKFICSGSRVSGEIVLVESLKKIYSGTKYMILSTYSILPKYFLLVLIGITVFILLYEIIRQKKDKATKIIESLKVIYIIVLTLLASIAPQIMQNTSSIWMVARSTYTYASLYGILILYLFMNYIEASNIKYIIIILSVILLIVQFYSFNNIETDRYKLNAIDYEISRKINNKIVDYEKETGIEVNQISIYNDKSRGYTYEGIFATGDINVKAFSTDWSIQYMFKYYYGKNLKVTENDVRNS